MEYEKFFCVCEHCGSMEWIDANGESNALYKNGDMLIDKDIWESMEEGDYICHECEKPLKPLMFSNITKKERIKIYNMSEETRANWMKSYEIVDELERDGDEIGSFQGWIS